MKSVVGDGVFHTYGYRPYRQRCCAKVVIKDHELPLSFVRHVKRVPYQLSQANKPSEYR